MKTPTTLPIEIADIESRFRELIAEIDCYLNQRGVLYIARATRLLTEVRWKQAIIAEVSTLMPIGYASATWEGYRTTFENQARRLQRIIRGVRIPLDDHEATERQT